MTGAQRDGSCFNEIKCQFKFSDSTGSLDGATAFGELPEFPDLIG